MVGRKSISQLIIDEIEKGDLNWGPSKPSELESFAYREGLRKSLLIISESEKCIVHLKQTADFEDVEESKSHFRCFRALLSSLGTQSRTTKTRLIKTSDISHNSTSMYVPSHSCKPSRFKISR